MAHPKLRMAGWMLEWVSRKDSARTSAFAPNVVVGQGAVDECHGGLSTPRKDIPSSYTRQAAYGNMLPLRRHEEGRDFVSMWIC